MTWFLDSNFICLSCRKRRLMQAGRTDDRQEPYLLVECDGFPVPTYFFDDPKECAEYVPKGDN